MTRERKPRTDFLLLGLTLLLTCIGVLLVFDASYAYALGRHISEYKYVLLQSAWGVVGIAAMLIVSKIPYWKWRGMAVAGILISAVLLVAVFIPHIGIAAKGAHRWVGHGEFRIQPSELAKLAVVIYLAAVGATRPKAMKNFKKGPLVPLCMVGLLALLIAREPDLGTALVIFLTGLTVLSFAGMRTSHTLAIIACGVALVGMVLGVGALSHHKDYQLARIMVFLHPEQDKQGDGYQIYQSMISLGSGGIFGVGIGEGREKTYLPEAHTDFIFAVLGEEGGLLAGLALLLLYALLVTRGLQIAYNSKDPFGSLLAGGIAAWIGIQSLINVGVVTGSIPATGVPLPGMSYGGSSLLITLAAVGILLNIARHPEGDPSKKADERLDSMARDFDRRWDKHIARPTTVTIGVNRRTRGNRRPVTTR